MSIIKKILVGILILSFVVFCALFGSLPRLRKTPIGYINRLIWIKIPGLALGIDRLLTGGRTTSFLKRTGHWLMWENHPLVLIFYITIVAGAQLIFLSTTWTRLSSLQKLLTTIFITLPYVFTTLTVRSTASHITPATHAAQMRQYPYDHLLFHPGQICRTCRLPKPARSKHCRICNVCVAKHDHHCIWVMNCVGRANHVHFLSMLAALAAMLTYGAYLAQSILDAQLQATFEASIPPTSRELGKKVPRWSAGLSLTTRFDAWAGAFTEDISLGAVGMLGAFTAPLAAGLLAYQLYLVWAGMTTSESFKWDDWRYDVDDGYIYKCSEPDGQGRRRKPRVRVVGLGGEKDDGDASEGSRMAENGGEMFDDESIDPYVPWPVESKLRVLNTASRASVDEEPDADLSRPPWDKVASLSEIINIYDLGFWANLRDLVRPKRGYVDNLMQGKRGGL